MSFLGLEENTKAGLNKISAAAVAVSLATSVQAANFLEEVIVTATKREESLQDIPVAVTAFSSEAIEKLGFADSYDIAAQVPNLQFKTENSVTSPQIYMRGIGNHSYSYNSINSVAVYNDGVYVGQNVAQGFQIFDLERVEVLRGPQGTLFGRNATAGLINFISRKPEIGGGFNANAKVTVGNYGKLDFDGAVGFDLSDTAAARLAINRQSHDGVFDNDVSGLEGEVDLYAIRGMVAWDITSEFNMLVTARYGQNNSQSQPSKAAFLPFDPTAPLAPPLPAAFNCAGGVAPAVPGKLFSPCSDPFGAGLITDSDHHDVQNNTKGYEDTETWGISVELNWDLGDHSLVSVTSWDDVEAVGIDDDDGHMLDLAIASGYADAEWFSQELRITSSYDGVFNWIAGAYYYSDELYAEFTPVNIDVFHLGWTNANTVETESWALFGELRFDLTDKLKLTIGGRFTEDEREGVSEGFDFVPLSNGFISTDEARLTSLGGVAIDAYSGLREKETWEALSGRVALDYQLNDNTLLYISASRGFKGGEFPGAVFSQDSVVMADPEFINNYEIGYKGDLLDNTLRLNLAAFSMDLSDQQTLIAPQGSVVEVLVNAGSSEIRGVEFEMQWQPNDAWFVQLAGAYLDAEFEKFINPGTGEDFSGHQLPEAPEWTFNGLVRYEMPLLDGVLSLQTDWSWNDDRFFSVDNNPARAEEDYALVNARASYVFPNERFEITLFANNVTDEEYVTTAFDSSVFSGAYVNIIGDPLTYGASFSYKYE